MSLDERDQRKVDAAADRARELGAAELLAAMRALRSEYDLNSVAVTQWLPAGRLLTVTVTSHDFVTFEDGENTQVRF